MQADWQFEVGGAAPVIDAAWAGFVDLSLHPEHASFLAEAIEFEPLAVALARLNSSCSPVWTAKCDFFPNLAEEEYDALEMEAGPEDAIHAVACYIDLLAADDGAWRVPEGAAEACKRVCSLLQAAHLTNCCADLVIRSAICPGGIERFGVTAYITACGPDADAARRRLESALDIFTDSVTRALVREIRP